MKLLYKTPLLVALLFVLTSVFAAEDGDDECHLPVCEPGTVLVLGPEKNGCPSAECRVSTGSGSTGGILPTSLQQCCSTKREECEYNGLPSAMCSTVYQMCVASQQCTIN